MAIFHGNSIPAGGSGSYYDYEINNSLRFNKDNNPYLTHPDSFSPNSPYTVSFWVKRGKISENNYVYRINSADNLYFDSNDNIQVERRSGGLSTSRVFRDISSWYHIVVKSTSSDYKLYVNGVLEQTTTSGANPYSAGTFNIGNSAPSTSTSNAFDGYMAEWHWVDGQALGPENFGETGTYGDWKPKEYTGSHGSSGFYLDFGNPNSLKSLSGNGNVVHSTSESKFGSSSIAFDGSTDYIQTPDSDDFSFGTGDMSFSCWARFNNFTNAQGHLFISHWNPGGNKGFRCMYSGGALKMDVHIGSEIQVVNQSWSASVDTWYHIRFNRTAGQFNVFVDGVKQGTGSTNTGNVTNSSGNIQIGSDGHSFTFSDMDGFLDDIEFTTSNQNGTSNFDKPTAYSTTTSSTKLLIQSNSSSNNSSTFVDSAGVSGGVGHDSSGNGNHFTPNNITTSDQVKDTPTNNFCTMNPLDNSYAGSTFSQGNLGLFITGSAQPTNTATFGMTSGKWYWEVRQGTSGAGGGGVSYYGYLGIAGSLGDASGSQLGEHFDQYSLYANSAQQIRNNDSWNSYGATIGYTNGDIISMALDLDNNKMYWAKNGSYLNSGNPAGNSNGYSIIAPSATSLGAYFPAAGDGHSSSENYIFNFGQEGTFAGNETAGGNVDDNGIGNFKYAVPSGFLSLCTANLPEPTVMPSEHFNTVLYTGTGSSQTVSTGFQPDLCWVKTRSRNGDHVLVDILRGAGQILQPNTTNAEMNKASTGAMAIGSNGFTVSGGDDWWNRSGDNFVSWNWKANGSGSSNTDGVINTTSTSANELAGFSISKYAGSGNNTPTTVGHGLSKAPELVISKRIEDNAHGWSVGANEPAASLDFTDSHFLNDTSSQDDPVWWNDTAPTSTVVHLGGNSWNNYSSKNFMLYCFHSVEGYSKIGSYKGNGSSDGAFVYCGFRPQFLLIKPINYGDGWKLWDTARGAQNGRYNQYPPGDLKPNQPNAENFSTSFNFDFLSNGFKWRGTDNSVNGGYHYLYYAIAEQPFKHTNAR